MIYNKIAAAFTVLAGVGFCIKIYYESKLSNESRKANIDIFFRKIYNISSLLPLNKRRYKFADEPEVKKANIGLLIFYIGIILIALTTVIAFYSAGKL